MRALLIIAAIFAVACDKPSPVATTGTETTGQTQAGGDGHGHDHGDDAKPEDGHGHDHAHGHNHEGMTHRFDDAEKWAKEFDDPERDAWQKPQHVADLMEIKPGMVVADIGAGTGYFLSYLSKAAGDEGRVLGLDIEESMVTYMKKRAAESKWKNVDAKKIGPADPGLDAGSVDRVLIVDTWHHIGERGKYSAKLKESLKPGGAIYVVDFNVDSPKGPPKKHKLPAEAVVKDLEEGGLKAATIEEELPDQYIVKATVAP